MASLGINWLYRLKSTSTSLVLPKESWKSPAEEVRGVDVSVGWTVDGLGVSAAPQAAAAKPTISAIDGMIHVILKLMRLNPVFYQLPSLVSRLLGAHILKLRNLLATRTYALADVAVGSVDSSQLFLIRVHLDYASLMAELAG